MKKIGVMGGTFDPVHMAHLILAEAAFDKAGLDEVWFMPSKNPPHKQNKVISEDRHRVRMLELALEGFDHFSVSRFELEREGMTYSSDTFKMLKELHPDDKFCLIIGGDSLMQLDSWHEPGELFKYVTILATSRKGLEKEALDARIKHYIEDMGADIMLFDTPDMEISSSSIRERVRYYSGIEGMVGPKVAEYIKEQGLYTDTELDSIKKLLKNELKPGRYEHTMKVASTAYELAMIHGCDPHRAFLAGLLHDNGKALCYSDQVASAILCGLELTDTERAKPDALIHSKLGAYYARERFGVEDEEIVSAIECHTTGKPAMSLLEKIIFLADYIEPGREIPSDPPLAYIRLLARSDIDRAVYLELKNMTDYLKRLAEPIDMRTVETLRYYEDLIDSR